MTQAQARQIETLRQSCQARQAAAALRGPVDPDATFELNPMVAEKASQPVTGDFELSPAKDAK